MPLKMVKLVGMIGSVFGLLLAMPTFGGLLNLIGLLLILVAVRFVSTYAKDPRIFKYYFTFFTILIAIAVVRIIVNTYSLEIPPGAIVILLSLAQPVAVYFFLQSYRRITQTTGVVWFAITGAVSMLLSTLTALVNILIVALGESAFLMSLSFFFFRIDYAAVPVLGVVSFALLRFAKKRKTYTNWT